MNEFHTPEVVVMDLCDHNSIRPILEKMVESLGGVDILINNAGMSYRGEAVTTKLEVNRLLIEVNYLAQVEVTRGQSNIALTSNHLLKPFNGNWD